jgi:flagellar assembly factor FliW
MKVHTTRFGEIEIQESELIIMKGAILGFEHLRRFVLLMNDGKTPLWWLQCVDDSSVAFVVINPCMIKQDYSPIMHGEDLDFLDIRHREDIALLCIVTVRSHPFRVTVNLRAPILINAENRLANQVVLEDPDYPIQHDIIDNREAFTDGLSDEDSPIARLGKCSPSTATT